MLLAWVAIALIGMSQPVLAQQRPPAEVTQHALDELANCRVQHPEQCPTDTPTPLATSTPTLIPTLTSTPTEVVILATSTPTVEQPCWRTDPELGDPDNSFIVFDEQGVPVPCSVEATPTPTEVPTEVPIETATPTPVPTQTAVVVYRQAPAPRQPPPQRVEVTSPPVIVIQTVVVTQVPEPTQTPTVTPTPTPSPTGTARPISAAATPTLLPEYLDTHITESLTANTHTPALDIHPPAWLSGPLGILAIFGVIIGSCCIAVVGVYLWSNR